jgi:class 3 adenylate cyclase/DNA-binding CsgD family transcriptional regulator
VPMLSSLTPRELQIARAYVLGPSYRQVADRLCIAPSTVRTHLSVIYRKLGVSSKVALLRVLEATDFRGDGVEFGRPDLAPAQSPVNAATFASGGPGERRYLSLMSCSLANVAALSARLGAEDICDLIASFREFCEAVVRRHGGYVAHAMDCTVMACFGYPRADEYDAELAAYAALEIMAGVKLLTRSPAVEMQTKIGIASGMVSVNQRMGAGGITQETFAGEALRVALALQAIAEPDGILCAGNTRSLLGDLIDCRENGERLLEGAGVSMQTWRMLGERPGLGRFQATRGRSATGSLVGRAEQAELLDRRWKRASAGVGHVVVMTGEPGIGKSRLIDALCQSAAIDPRQIVSFHCSPHHQASALYPVIRQIARDAGYESDEPLEAKLDKLEAFLARTHDDLSEVVPLIADLLSLPAHPRYPPLELTPERRKARTLEVLGGQIEALAKQKPALVIFEDLQWSDPATRELLDELVERIETLPVLLLITHRADARHPWAGNSNVTTMALTQLDRVDSEHLLLELLGARELPGQWLAQFARKADGVPLFLEELARSVIDVCVFEKCGPHATLGPWRDESTVPGNLHDLLEARLDCPGQGKAAAQQGAVIGRRFSYELLAAVSPLDEVELKSALAGLVAAELVSVHGTPPMATYTFQHTLVQEAAYSSLPRVDRVALHARIKSVLESRYPDVIEKEPELLARHSAGAGFREAAIDYWRKAGERAVQSSANVEALGCPHSTKCLAQFARPGICGPHLRSQALLVGPDQGV